MEEVYDRQKMQEDMQRSSEFVDVFSKVVSGKSGYKTKVQRLRNRTSPNTKILP